MAITRLRTAGVPVSVVRFILSITAVLCVSHTAVGGPQAEPETRPFAEQPYHGISVGNYTLPDDQGARCIVGWIYPGPLEGTGFNSKFVNRGEFILAINGQEISSADEFQDAISLLAPGDEVQLKVQRTNPPNSGSLPTPGAGTEVETVSFTLASRADWQGPVSRVEVPDVPKVPAGLDGLGEEPTPLEAFVNAHVIEQGLDEPIRKLEDYFVESLNKSYGLNMLSYVAYGFHHPTRLSEMQQALTDPLAGIASDPSGLTSYVRGNLDIVSDVHRARMEVKTAPDWADPSTVALTIVRAVEAAHIRLDAAFFQVSDAQRRDLPATMREMTDLVANEFYINSSPDPQRLIRALNTSGQIDFDALMAAADEFGAFMPYAEAPDVAGAGTVPLPDGLVNAVTGDVLAIVQAGKDWIIYGGSGANEYDMSLLSVVVDAGGNDVYRYPSQQRPTVQAIIDFAGNDRYVASGSSDGPGSAMLGVNLIVDHAGNDRYEGAGRSCGVGMMGVGVILDHGGADQYTGTRWSLGAAFYGLGAIIDLGNQSDVYTAHHFSQAIGGPRGFGLILDQAGRDLYRCNGPIPSGYGTDAVYAGISQGVGFGVRGYDTGGIGLLADLGGADRYEAGEFSQGGAYYWGLGILYDRAGRDLYYGNRYGQAFAAHQALGVLADDGGDDTYWGMTAATQSGSWDICSTLLIDRGGNDTYQADGLAQGGASMQAIAWLVDLDGSDRYSAPNGSTQGQSGGNSYHYEATGCYSWSMLLDAGGTPDMYSRSDRSDGMVISTGSATPKKPENSGLHGLFIDTAERVTFD
ncbi:MAG: hypothetical protein HND57_05020 [Planctomycetes bacterium]|nr:hypothetical protein [Planctomycetota bacterium]